MCELLTKPAQTVTLDGCSAWLFANADSLGYYRTAYGSKDLAALGAAAQDSALSALEQSTLLEDAWALVRLNQQNIADFLSLSRQIAAAPLGPAIVTVLNRIDYISDHLIDPPQRPAFERWVRDALKPVADELGSAPRPQESDERRTDSSRHALHAGLCRTRSGRAERGTAQRRFAVGECRRDRSEPVEHVSAIGGDQRRPGAL